MLISSYINLPFGCWAYCQYPAIVEANSAFGTIKSGSDLLIWIGSLELIIARDSRKASAPSVLHRTMGFVREYASGLTSMHVGSKSTDFVR